MSQTSFYAVLRVFVHTDPLLVHLTLDGEVIETTPDHPFSIAEGEGLAAAELQPGQRIRNAAGDYGLVEALQFVVRPEVMYNLSVAEAHTYFVGVGRWLVHNQCPPLRGKAATEAAKQLGFTKRIPPQKAPFNSHGQPVFYNSRKKTYITPDIDMHRGGVWKMFDRHGNRLGTYDASLNLIGP